MSDPLDIALLRPGWISGPEDDPDDLCLHGGVRVTRGAAVLLEDDGDGYTVSAGALNLLRTLELDHRPDAPLDEKLVPCCGNMMYEHEVSGLLVAMSCPNGVNWWVEHREATVELTFGDGAHVRVPHEEWRHAVVRFADAVLAFYLASAPKELSDPPSHDWYPAFWGEWMTRRGAVGYAGSPPSAPKFRTYIFGSDGEPRQRVILPAGVTAAMWAETAEHSLDEHLPPEFVQRHTAGRFEDLEDLLTAAGLSDATPDAEAWLVEHEAELSVIVATHTRFATLDEMLEAGTRELIERLYGL